MAKTKTDKKKPERTDSAAPQVRVRMYRHGLGDCFLLTLPGAGDRPFYLMIDCGVILGTADPGTKMEGVIRNVIETTGGHVDLLVATHEHWDHLSGFLQAADLFAAGSDGESPGKLHVHALWLAWTESSADELANLLRGQRKKTERGLRLALQRLRAVELEDAGAAEAERTGGWTASQQVASLLGFFGASSRKGTGDALEAVCGYARSTPRYLSPGEPPIELEGVPGIRIFVLGPPRDEKLIKKSSPSRSHSEVYEMAFGLTPDNAFFAAALDEQAAVEGGFSELREATQPFDRKYRVPELQAKQWPFFQRFYWGAAVADRSDQSWRRIDAEWLGAAAELALKLDSDTNNTSLALAIELTATGRVLLFPGDAQVGNWLSWENVSWTLDGGREVTAHDLLGRTVLYKVGHHGSHNATLREKGLELMHHEDLVALVPVDHAMAVRKRWPEIPFDPLLERLHEKARGRVLRSDDTVSVAEREPPAGVAAAEWRRFQSRVEETELYFEYRLEL
jgi:hypothetical protein